MTERKLLEFRFLELNPTERRIVRQWERSGMTHREAVARLYADLADAAEEDGYDGA